MTHQIFLDLEITMLWGKFILKRSIHTVRKTPLLIQPLFPFSLPTRQQTTLGKGEFDIRIEVWAFIDESVMERSTSASPSILSLSQLTAFVISIGLLDALFFFFFFFFFF